MSHKQYFKNVNPAIVCPIAGYVDTNNPEAFHTAAVLNGFVDSNNPEEFQLAAETNGYTVELMCPTAGWVNPESSDFPYIPNPIPESDGWIKILEFQTNSDQTTTFDPTIQFSSGDFAWNLSGGIIMKGSANARNISYTFPDNATKTVALYAKDSPVITSIDFSNDKIVGVLDISHSAFKSITSITLSVNSNLTNFILPPIMDGIFVGLNISSCGLSGTLDLRPVKNFMTTVSSTSNLQFYNNPLLTNILVPEAGEVTGYLAMFISWSTDLSGALDLSCYDKWSSTSSIQLNANSKLTSLTFAPSINSDARFTMLWLYGLSLLEELDISMFSAWTSNVTNQIQLQACTKLTILKLPNFTSGGVYRFYAYGLSSLTTMDASGIRMCGAYELYIKDNPLMNSLQLPSHLSDGFASLQLHSLPLITSMDISGYVPNTIITTGLTVYIHSNYAMSTFTMYSSALGTYTYFHLYGNTSLSGILNVSNIRLFKTSAQFYLHNNGNVSEITFSATPMTVGTFSSLNLSANSYTSIPDLTRFAASMFQQSGCTINISTCGLSSAQVNQILTTLNTLITTTLTRSIRVGNNTTLIPPENDIPDSTSGGYNGLTAKTALTVKSVSVYITTKPPVLSATYGATDITKTTATSGGDILSDGANPVTAKGVCWKTSTGPTISNSKTSNGTGTDSFTSSITGLAANTTYFVRAYATNTSGTSYGPEITFTTLP